MATPTLTTLVSFNGGNGSDPVGDGLMSDAAGDLFGTTYYGGANNDGTVFEIPITASGYGAPITLASFNGTNGQNPFAGLTRDAAGDLFGTTQFGGANGVGTVFEIPNTASGYGAPITLATFNGLNGADPQAALIADAAGDLFGTTISGGAYGYGTVFEIPNTASGYGAPITLVSFNGTNGAYTEGALIIDAAGDLFGTTEYGGANNDGTVFEIPNTGSGYSSTPTTLISFDGTNGAVPYGSLTADASGDLSGTTTSGGASGYGTVFEITNSGYVASYSWANPVSGDWETASNWTPGVPGAANDASVSVPGNYTVTISSGDAAAAASVALNAGTLQFAGGSLTANAVAVGAGASLTGFGVVSAPVTNAGFVGAAGGTLDLAGGLGGTGSVTVNDGATLQTGGALDDAGTVFLDGTSLGATLNLGANFTIESGGNLTLSDNPSNLVSASGASALLENAGTISGAGTIAPAGTLQNDTSGVIDANYPDNPLVIGAGALVNNGVLETTNGGTLQVLDAVTGSGYATINTGTLEVGSSDAQAVTFGAGTGTLKLDPRSAFTGPISGLAPGDIIEIFDATSVVSATINGSTLLVTDSSGNTLSFKQIAGALAGNAFAIENSGGFAPRRGGCGGCRGPRSTNLVLTPIDNAIQSAEWGSASTWSGGVPSATTPAAIDGETVTVSPADAATANTVTLSSSTLDLSGSLSAVSVSADANSVIDNVSGSNTISGAVFNDGAIDVEAGTSLAITGPLFGTGSATVADGATLELNGSTAQTITFSGSTGTLLLDSGSNVTGTLGLDMASKGTVTVTNNASISAGSSDAIDITPMGPNGLGYMADVTNTGTISGNNGVSTGVPLTPLEVNNSGTISAVANAINGGYGDVTVVNSGALSGGGATVASNGSVTLTNTGSISGFYAVQADGSVNATNSGTISGISDAIFGYGNVQVTNAASGIITSQQGDSIHGLGTPATVTSVTNLGTISGGVDGVDAYNVDLTNSGTINATVAGAASYTANITNTNIGQIIASGPGSIGIATEGGTVTNAGTISGAEGVFANGGIFDLINSGTVTGTGGTAILFTAAGETLTVEAGSQINGAIDLVEGDTIDVANTIVTSAVIQGSSLLVTDNHGNVTTYQIGPVAADDIFVRSSDGAGGTNLTLTAAPPPVTANNTVTTPEDIAYTFKLSDFPFTDPNGSLAGVVLTSLTQPSGSILTLNGAPVPLNTEITAAQIAAGDLVFTQVNPPSFGTFGNNFASFGFEVVDQNGTSAAAAMTINVAAPPPKVTAALANPSTGDEGIGKTVAITLTFNEPVTVSGAGPSLALNDGGTATYVSGSGTNTLSFTYTVAGTDTSVAALAVTAVTNGSTVTGVAGTTPDFSAADTTFTGLQVDTLVPTVTMAAASPSTGDEGIGKTVTVTLTFNKPVTVSGAGPSVKLNDGGSATYVSGSGTNTLTFTYTVASTDTSVASLAITSITNGSTVTDAAGNTATFTGANATFTGLQVDTIVPAITALAASPASGVEQVGSTITIAVTFSEAVTVAGGTPKLLLNDGGVATYTSGSGTNTLTFTYKVGVSDTSLPALAVTALNANGATIADAAGNAANLSGAAKSFAGLQIDTVTPVITQVLTSPASGDIGLNQTITVTVAFDKPVTVKGTPKLTLNDGGSATYTSGSGTSALTFTYKVAAGQNTSDLQSAGIALPSGASIKDAAGHAANLAGAVANLGLIIDSMAPTVSSIGATPASGDLNAGKTVAIALAMNEPVAVTGSPTLSLNDGGTANYDAAHSTATSLVFDYTVAAGQNTASLTVTSLNLPSGSSIEDLAGNAASTTLPASKALGIQIDTKAPTVTAESASASSSDLNAGKTAEITLTMSEAVAVSGTPTLSLNDGGMATYDAALSSATALTFDYTVLAGQNTAALKVSGFSPAGSITDLAGNPLATIPGTNLGLQIDTVTPAVSSVTANHALGTAVGDQIAITLKMNEAVTVAGTPGLLLSNGGTAAYNPAASTATSLVFDYTIAANQGTGSSNLSVIGTELSSQNAILDGAGNIGTLQLTAAEANLGFKITSTPAGSPANVTVSGTQEAELFGASSQNVTFASGADGILKLDTAQSYTGSVSGLTQGDTLDLANLTYGPNMTAGYSGTSASGVLTAGNGSLTASIHLLGNYLASTFTLASDGHGGTTVVDPPKLASAPLIAGTKAA